MIDVSGSELFAVSAKALLGAGVGQAVADDGARAALWLHAKGYNGTAALAEASRGSTSAQRLGVSAVDLLAARTVSQFEVASVDSPLLFAGLLGVAASQHGLFFTANCTTESDSVEIAPTTISGPVERLTAPLTITCAEAADGKRQPARAMRMRVPEADWHQVTQAASRTYVPSNERSRATGAGAGLIDAD